MPTVKELIDLIENEGIKPPSGLRKDQLIEFYDALIYAKQNGLSLEVATED